jgi:hypothetical protein
MTGLTTVGTFGTACCTAAAFATTDPAWLGAAGGVAGATLVIAGLLRLRAADRLVEWLLEPAEDVPDAPKPGPGIPVPTDPTPASPEDLARLHVAFEALDNELRQAHQFRERIAAAQARRRDKVWPTPLERRLWTDLRSQLEDA